MQSQIKSFLFILVVFCGIFWVAPEFIVHFLAIMPEPIGSRAELFREGIQTTLKITLTSAFIGLWVGLSTALLKLCPLSFARILSRVYIGVFQGTPLLTQVLFAYYALPVIVPGLNLNEFSAAVIALSLNVGAYNAEAIRAGILSVPQGQIDAAASLGFTKMKIYRYVILPQSIQVMLPPLMNNLVALLKDSAIVSAIGLLELTLTGNRITSETFQPVPILITIAGIYLLLTTLLSSSIYALTKLKQGERDTANFPH